MKAGTETKTPAVSTMTELSYSTTLGGTRTDIGYVQSIPEMLKTPDSITYSAVDIPDERQAKGRIKAEDMEIEILFTESQWDEIRAVQEAGTEVYVHIKLPDNTANTDNKPIVFYFKATMAIGMSSIEIDDMLKSKIKLYRSSEIKESKGFPTAQAGN